MAVPPLPLTTPARVKNHLRLSGDEHDAALVQHIAAISEAVEQYCRRPFARAQTSEIFDGPGDDAVFLRRRPVHAITAVWDDPSRRFDPARALPETSCVLYPETGVLKRVDGYFARGARTVRVDYDGGFDEPPAALVQAANVLVAHYFVRGQQGGDGLASESMGAYQVSYDAADWPASAKALLAEYRELSL